MTRFLFICLACILACAAPAAAQWAEGALPQAAAVAPPSAGHFSNGIAAVVNDQIVSTHDVQSRIALALLSAGLPDSSDMREKLLPQVLRGLIDERLQEQEGKRLGIAVTDDEVDRAMKELADRNQVPGGDMKAFLAAHGVPPSALTAQIRAVLTWNKVVQRTVRPRVDISEDEIKAAAERLRANAGKDAYLISEIYLSVDKPGDEDQVRAFADNLVDQIKGGANFGSIARQFSQGSSAASGGDIGWLQAGQMAPELDRVLQTMRAGEIAGPIRAADGFHIVGVREKKLIAANDPKDVRVHMAQFFRPYDATGDRNAPMQEGEKLRARIQGCNGLEALAADFKGWKTQDLGETTMADMPDWLAVKVRDLNDGQASAPLATDRGALMLVLCHRTVKDLGVDHDAIRNAIGQERLELLARRALRDLHRDASIDVRMTSAS